MYLYHSITETNIKILNLELSGGFVKMLNYGMNFIASGNNNFYSMHAVQYYYRYYFIYETSKLTAV